MRNETRNTSAGPGLRNETKRNETKRNETKRNEKPRARTNRELVVWVGDERALVRLELVRARERLGGRELDPPGRERRMGAGRDDDGACRALRDRLSPNETNASAAGARRRTKPREPHRRSRADAMSFPVRGVAVSYQSACTDASGKTSTSLPGEGPRRRVEARARSVPRSVSRSVSRSVGPPRETT